MDLTTKIQEKIKLLRKILMESDEGVKPFVQGQVYAYEEILLELENGINISKKNIDKINDLISPQDLTKPKEEKPFSGVTDLPEVRYETTGVNEAPQITSEQRPTVDVPEEMLGGSF